MGGVRYHAALWNLRAQTKCLCEAFVEAAKAAREVDPEGLMPADPYAEQTLREVASLLHIASQHVPGAREVLALALGKES